MSKYCLICHLLSFITLSLQVFVSFSIPLALCQAGNKLFEFTTLRYNNFEGFLIETHLKCVVMYLSAETLPSAFIVFFFVCLFLLGDTQVRLVFTEH